MLLPTPPTPPTPPALDRSQPHADVHTLTHTPELDQSRPLNARRTVSYTDGFRKIQLVAALDACLRLSMSASVSVDAHEK